MDDKQDIKEKLLKLLRLSEQGVGGEAINAEKMLQKILEKHGLKMSDITDAAQEPVDLVVSYRNSYEETLFTQICYRVIGSKQFANFKYRGKSNKIGINATPAQNAQIMTMYDIYRKALKSEQQILFRAFIQKHRIFGNKSDDEPEQKITDEDIRAMKMQGTLQDVAIHKQIAKG